MNTHWLKKIKHTPLYVGVGLALGLAVLPSTTMAAGVLDHHKARLADFDSRKAVSLSPSQTQLNWVQNKGFEARWNMFGTPQSLINRNGVLEAGLVGETAEDKARGWLAANASVFNMTAAEMANLTLINTNEIKDSSILLFEQTFNGLPAAFGGRVNIAIKGNDLVYVSSSLAGNQGVIGEATLDATAAWLKAASGVGKTISAVNVKTLPKDHTWTMFQVPGFAQPQRARLAAFPTPDKGVRIVYETIVLNVLNGEAEAYTSFVDAQSGEVLSRQNKVQNFAMAETFTGEYADANSCGPLHGPYTLQEGNYRIVVSGHEIVAANDVVIKLHNDDGLLMSADVGSSPDALLYEPGGGVAAGNYYAQVCPYSPAVAEPHTYVGSISWDAAPLPDLYTVPTWRVFPTGPSLEDSSVDTREKWCWNDKHDDGAQIQDCERVVENDAARAPWDFDYQINDSTLTTIGNGASTSVAWGSPLTPAENTRPVAANRQYNFPFNDTWRTNECSPASFGDVTSGSANDAHAATANLFVMHNRMHDWSYNLGFTERNSNLQKSNFGRTGKERENDFEVGNVQAGGISGGAPSYLGRDNANQITLNDGIAPITNMYLWQPIAGAFYAPCSDGDFDMSVIGHEYGHAIQNRMVNGPNGSIDGDQGRAMGESWGDLTAVEYLFSNGFVYPGSNPFAVGAFVTGDKERGIRNFAMNNSPLNYSNVGYDFVCNSYLTDLPGTPCASLMQSHADGEIWSAVNYDIREALVAKYDSQFPYNDDALQQRCADGGLPSDLCPGNRRWIQMMHDAFLLMPTTQSMLDARDAMLVADVLRFDGANQKEMWAAFAQRGFGINASTLNEDDADPIGDFESPMHNNALVTFNAVAADESIDCNGCNDERALKSIAANVYVGRFEARTTPITMTSGDHNNLAAPVKLMAGTYEFLVVAPGYGHFRFTRSVEAGEQVTLVPRVPSNWASSAQGTVASGAGENFEKLIDDTEFTNWTHQNDAGVAGSEIVLELGALRTVNRVQVSALPEVSGNRFHALRQFEVLSCNDTVMDCNDANNYRSFFVSARDAFPAAVPRPTVANLHLRSFDTAPTGATHLKLRVLNNQCTGSDLYSDGNLDADPTNETDCRLGRTGGNPADRNVRIAEFQAFSNDGELTVPGQAVSVTTNLAPVAQNDVVTARPNLPVNIRSLDNDMDPESGCLIIGNVATPANGVVKINKGNCENGYSDTITYTPAFGFIGVNRFDYTILDNAGNAATANIKVRVR